jgi:hypothetical protein
MPSGNYPPFLILGKVAVTTAGTPVGLLDAFTLNGASLKAAGGGPAKYRCASILFVVSNLVTVNTGFIYVGVKGMNKSTGAGVIFMIPAAGTGVTNYFTLPSQGWGGGNELTPEDIYIDADTNGNSALVTCIQY